MRDRNTREVDEFMAAARQLYRLQPDASWFELILFMQTEHRLYVEQERWLDAAAAAARIRYSQMPEFARGASAILWRLVMARADQLPDIALAAKQLLETLRPWHEPRGFLDRETADDLANAVILASARGMEECKRDETGLFCKVHQHQARGQCPVEAARAILKAGHPVDSESPGPDDVGEDYADVPF